MEADILRLILLLTGVGLVLGIYFWDRRARGRSRAGQPRSARKRSALTPGVDPGGEGDSQWRVGDAAALDLEVDLDRELDELDEILSEERPGRRRAASPQPPGKSRQRRGHGGQGDFFAEAEGGEGAAATGPAPSALSDVPSKIVQINVVSRGSPFEGNDILRAAYATELTPGEMQIFHRYPHGKSSGRALFSMVSMVEPGSFPFDAMADFSTPGLSLFAQLPGPQDGLAVFSDMLFTAERLAALLDGELQDETHSALTKQTIEHIREGLLEYRRRARLLRKA